eukprot:8826853-Alexandrium_andersonii.AAC.1
MSASLVGSEMCIRDSCRAQEIPDGLQRIFGEFRIFSDSFGELLELRGAPVSYTHLTLPTICSV